MDTFGQELFGGESYPPATFTRKVSILLFSGTHRQHPPSPPDQPPYPPTQPTRGPTDGRRLLNPLYEQYSISRLDRPIYTPINPLLPNRRRHCIPNLLNQLSYEPIPPVGPSGSETTPNGIFRHSRIKSPDNTTHKLRGQPARQTLPSLLYPSPPLEPVYNHSAILHQASPVLERLNHDPCGFHQQTSISQSGGERKHEPFEFDTTIPFNISYVPQLTPPSTLHQTPAQEPSIHEDGHVPCCWGGSCPEHVAATDAKIRAHIFKRHFKNDGRDITSHIKQKGGSSVVCEWNNPETCRKEIQLENMGRHILSVHLKAGGGVCKYCGLEASRSDSTKRHEQRCPSNPDRNGCNAEIKAAYFAAFSGVQGSEPTRETVCI